MSVESVNAINWELSGASATGERSYVVTYLVKTTDPDDGPLTAALAAGIPVINTAFSQGNDFDNGAYARDYSARLRNADESKRLWEVQVSYSTEPTKRNDTARENDPVNQAPIISGGGVRFSRIVEELEDGSPLVNSAGDLLTGVEADDDRPSLRIQKNFDTIDQSQFLEFSNTVNNATFFGLPARSWKLSHPRWEQRFRGSGTPYYTVTFEFEGRKSTWDINPYDRGHYFLNAAGNKERFKANGIIQSSPQNLDGGGGELDAGQDPVKIQGGSLEIYKKKDFSLLDIPTDF